jgi:hypothetical protein
MHGRAISIGAGIVIFLLAALTAHADPFSSGSAGAFAGTWQGGDIDDGSAVTLILIQQGNSLNGTFSDSHSTNAAGTTIVGYSGSGTGAISGSTANMTFSLTRPDGDSAQVAVVLTLSGSQLEFAVSHWNEHTLSPPGVWANLSQGGSSGTGTSSGSVVEVGSMWIDTFEASSLDQEWWWVRESSSYWNLDTGNGTLDIKTQQGTLYGNADDARNILLRDAPGGDFILETHVHYLPSYNYQNAGIIVYENDGNYLLLGRAHCDHCGGNMIFFDYEENGQVHGTGEGFSTSELSEAYLKIVKQGSTYSGYYSSDGEDWRLVHRHTGVGVNPTGVGVATLGSTEGAMVRTAEFDYVAVDTEVTSASGSGPSITLSITPKTPGTSGSTSGSTTGSSSSGSSVWNIGDIGFTVDPWAPSTPGGATITLPPGGLTVSTDLAIEVKVMCVKANPHWLAFSFQACAECTVKNVSSIASGTYDVQFYFFDKDGTLVGGTAFNDEPSLAAGASRTTYYYCTDYVAYDKFPVKVVAVVPKVAGEENTTNNTAERSINHNGYECPAGY